MSAVMNSSGMWIACSFMVIVVLLQSFLFLKKSLKRAPEVGLTSQQVKSGIRGSVLASIGPSLAPILALMSLVIVIGAPLSWMRMNDVGASRTELGMASAAAEVVGGDLMAEVVSNETVAAVVWGMSLNNVGWMLVALFLTKHISKLVVKMNTRFNPKWVSLILAGSSMGLFGYLTANQVVGKTPPALVAVAASAVTMLIIDKTLSKYRWIREPSMGICMIVGMAAAQIYASMIG